MDDKNLWERVIAVGTVIVGGGLGYAKWWFGGARAQERAAAAKAQSEAGLSKKDESIKDIELSERAGDMLDRAMERLEQAMVRLDQADTRSEARRIQVAELREELYTTQDTLRVQVSALLEAKSMMVQQGILLRSMQVSVSELEQCRSALVQTERRVYDLEHEVDMLKSATPIAPPKTVA